MIDQDIAVPNPQGWLNAADAIFHNARRRPSHAAIVDGGSTITYAELAALVAKTAGHIETIGVEPGDIVTTGTLTRALPILPGESWGTTLRGIELGGRPVWFA